MIVTRTLSLVLRFLQFLFSAIVLGLTASFLHQRNKYNADGPFNRLIYTLVIACLSLVLALVWMVPTTNTILHWGTDLFFPAAWFAVFGLLQEWYSQMGCGSGWNWDRVRLWGDTCGQWNAAQAFAFLAAVLWFVSFILGLLTWAKRDRAAAPAAGEGVVAPAGRRRRWFKRSAV